MLVFTPGEPVLFTAASRPIVMLLGGEPVGPRFIEWNFVSSSKERIEQAKADWRAGRMKLPDLDDQRVHSAAARSRAAQSDVVIQLHLAWPTRRKLPQLHFHLSPFGRRPCKD